MTENLVPVPLKMSVHPHKQKVYACQYCKVATGIELFRITNASKCKECQSAHSKIINGTQKNDDPCVIAYCKGMNMDLETMKERVVKITIPSAAKTIIEDLRQEVDMLQKSVDVDYQPLVLECLRALKVFEPVIRDKQEITLLNNRIEELEESLGAMVIENKNLRSRMDAIEVSLRPGPKFRHVI